MKSILRLSLSLLLTTLYSNSIHAQVPDSLAHDYASKMIVSLYNDQQFRDIYLQTNSDFRAAVPESDFMSLLEKGLYTSLGKITGMSYLSRQQDFYSYLIRFGSGDIRMDMGLDAKKQIAFFQFIPYEPEVPTKRTNFLSDNKKQSPLDSAVQTAVLSYIQSPENSGISLGISVNGTRYFYNYGETKRDNKQLPSTSTIYEIGSVSKTFCGLLLAMAVTEKKIKLDDEITRYLPGKYPNLPSGKKAILIKHLANHTSGLPRLPEDMMSAPDFDSLNPYKHYSREMIYENLRKVKPEKDPGTVCEYSNYSMALLGLILEDLYKKSFEELVKEKICQPNGMKNTTVKLSADQSAVIATGYNPAGVQTPYWELNGFAAAGALRSTSQDLLTYLDYNRKEKDAATKLAHTITFSDRQNVGLAWFISKTKAGNNMVWHNGGTYGFSSFCGYIKEKDIEICILANSGTSTDYIAIAILNYLQSR